MYLSALDFIASEALILLAPIVMKRGNRPGLVYMLCLMLFTGCMTLVFSLTGVSFISGFHTDIRLDRVNLIPFDGISRVVSGGLNSYSLRNILGNVLMFVPLGFFAPLLSPRMKNPLRTVAVGALTSLVIECTQLFLVRGTDIDDLILNSLGSLLGFCCYAVLARLIPRASGRRYPKGAALLFALAIIIPYMSTAVIGLCRRMML